MKAAPKPFTPGRLFTDEVKGPLDAYLKQSAEVDKQLFGLTNSPKLLERYEHENALAESAGQPLPYSPENLSFSKRYPAAVMAKRSHVKDASVRGAFRKLWAALAQALEAEATHAKDVADFCEHLSGKRPDIEDAVNRRIRALKEMEFVQHDQTDPRVGLSQFVQI